MTGLPGPWRFLWPGRLASQICLLVVGATLLFHGAVFLAYPWAGGPPGLPPIERRAPPAQWADRPLPPRGPRGPSPLLIVAGGTVLTLVSLLVWTTRRVTRPLSRLADSADRLGREGSTQPLAEDGPDEVRRAAQAFNLMQERLKRFVADRTRMLAAISHDYRTMLTRVRLRAEEIPDDDLKQRLLRDIRHMERMVETTLAFVHGAEVQEPVEWVDLPSLLRTVCDQFADQGFAVVYDGPPDLRFRCRPDSLERALANLVDNGVKYGGQVEVALRPGPVDGVSIAVRDDGPGIPTGEREKVFEPFYRMDPERTADKGGMGLGLSIARTIVSAHGGSIILADAAPRGLKATIELPGR